MQTYYAYVNFKPQPLGPVEIMADGRERYREIVFRKPILVDLEANDRVEARIYAHGALAPWQRYVETLEVLTHAELMAKPDLLAQLPID